MSKESRVESEEASEFWWINLVETISSWRGSLRLVGIVSGIRKKGLNTIKTYQDNRSYIFCLPSNQVDVRNCIIVLDEIIHLPRRFVTIGRRINELYPQIRK